MNHKPDCIWGQSDCEFKDTHHYCPHEEHQSLKCKCATPTDTRTSDVEDVIKLQLALSDLRCRFVRKEFGYAQYAVKTDKLVKEALTSFRETVVAEERERIRTEAIAETFKGGTAPVKWKGKEYAVIDLKSLTPPKETNK